MTQPTQRVLYLPPGVVAAPAPAPVPQSQTGLPFDRAFFEQLLPQMVANFCHQVECAAPLVEVMTVDGARHYVNGISGVTDQWVALHTTQPDHTHAVQTFVPYTTIYRVEIHPGSDDRRQLGFVLNAPAPPRINPMPEEPAPVESRPQGKKKGK